MVTLGSTTSKIRNALKSPTTQRSGLLVPKTQSKTSTAKSNKEITSQRRFQVANSKYLKQILEGKKLFKFLLVRSSSWAI